MLNFSERGRNISDSLHEAKAMRHNSSIRRYWNKVTNYVAQMIKVLAGRFVQQPLQLPFPACNIPADVMPGMLCERFTRPLSASLQNLLLRQDSFKPPVSLYDLSPKLVLALGDPCYIAYLETAVLGLVALGFLTGLSRKIRRLCCSHLLPPPLPRQGMGLGARETPLLIDTMSTPIASPGPFANRPSSRPHSAPES